MSQSRSWASACSRGPNEVSFRGSRCAQRDRITERDSPQEAIDEDVAVVVHLGPTQSLADDLVPTGIDAVAEPDHRLGGRVLAIGISAEVEMDLHDCEIFGPSVEVEHHVDELRDAFTGRVARELEANERGDECVELAVEHGDEHLLSRAEVILNGPQLTPASRAISLELAR